MPKIDFFAGKMAYNGQVRPRRKPFVERRENNKKKKADRQTDKTTNTCQKGRRENTVQWLPLLLAGWLTGWCRSSSSIASVTVSHLAAYFTKCSHMTWKLNKHCLAGASLMPASTVTSRLCHVRIPSKLQWTIFSIFRRSARRLFTHRFRFRFLSFLSFLSSFFRLWATHNFSRLWHSKEFSLRVTVTVSGSLEICPLYRSIRVPKEKRIQKQKSHWLWHCLKVNIFNFEVQIYVGYLLLLFFYLFEYIIKIKLWRGRVWDSRTCAFNRQKYQKKKIYKTWFENFKVSEKIRRIYWSDREKNWNRK